MHANGLWSLPFYAVGALTLAALDLDAPPHKFPTFLAHQVERWREFHPDEAR